MSHAVQPGAESLPRHQDPLVNRLRPVIRTPLRLPAARRGARFTSVPRVTVAGLSFHALSEREVIELVVHEATAGRGGLLVTPNLHIARLCKRDALAASLIDAADLRTADGMPLVWASRFQRTPLPERVAGSSLVYSLSAAAAGTGLAVFLLGGAPGTAEASAAALTREYPSLRIAGTYCPPMGFESDPGEMQRIRLAVRTAQPAILYVALGCPKQEWLMRELRVEAPRAWMLGVGYSFSFLAGEARRAPRWMQRAGLEWVHRLAREPRRLFRRYVLECLPFGVRVLSRAGVTGLLRTLRRLGGSRDRIGAPVPGSLSP